MSKYSIKNQEGTCSIMQGKKTVLNFYSQKEGAEAIMHLWLEHEILPEAAYGLANDLAKITDLPDSSPERITLLTESLQTASKIAAGEEKPQYVPCKNCQNHGRVIGKDFLFRVHSKMEGYYVAEGLEKSQKITKEEKENLDQQILTSQMLLETSDPLRGFGIMAIEIVMFPG